jgi:hypothetical protein
MTATSYRGILAGCWSLERRTGYDVVEDEKPKLGLQLDMLWRLS